MTVTDLETAIRNAKAWFTLYKKAPRYPDRNGLIERLKREGDLDGIERETFIVAALELFSAIRVGIIEVPVCPGEPLSGAEETQGGNP
jgi:hypothetical protein